jgi:hypothetical protein
MMNLMVLMEMGLSHRIRKGALERKMIWRVARLVKLVATVRMAGGCSRLSCKNNLFLQTLSLDHMETRSVVVWCRGRPFLGARQVTLWVQ